MLWHPDAKRQPLEDAGPFTGGRPKLLWHTTEGATYPGTSIYHGTEPHFTFDFKLGRLYQHVALNRSAKGLEHPAGTGETNHDHVIQVELVDFAARAGLWTSAEYARIAALARWIEANAGVPRSCGVSFANPTRLTWTAFHNYAGHLGHVHAPNQRQGHTDPGRGFRVDRVVGSTTSSPPRRPKPAPHPTVQLSSRGESVHHLQSALRALGYGVATDAVFGKQTQAAVIDFQRKHRLTADGVVGPLTWKALHTALKSR
jgi:N-acetyl-anhydromuramyl-L-alanine amidase AmpD